MARGLGGADGDMASMQACDAEWPGKLGLLLTGDAAVRFKALRNIYKLAQNRCHKTRNASNLTRLRTALEEGLKYLHSHDLDPGATMPENKATLARRHVLKANEAGDTLDTSLEACVSALKQAQLFFVLSYFPFPLCTAIAICIRRATMPVERSFGDHL
jgi:hypothetical protein